MAAWWSVTSRSEWVRGTTSWWRGTTERNALPSPPPAPVTTSFMDAPHSRRHPRRQVVAVPGHDVREPPVERDLRPPAERGEAIPVQPVAQVVAGAIRNEGDEGVGDSDQVAHTPRQIDVRELES